MRCIIVPDYEQMCKKAAELFIAQVNLKPDSVLGLATGSTPVGMYKELIAAYRSGRVDFSGVRTFNLDEYRGLDAAHPQSYRYFMRKNLFDGINIPGDQIHFLDGQAEDPAAACAAYERGIEECGGIDMQLLGIGRNGHIGFNEPGDTFPVHSHLTGLTQSTIEANARFFDSIDEVPTEALTMGIGSIFSARRIVLLANGEGKAEVLEKMIYGPVTPEVPASILQLHKDTWVIADEKAAGAVLRKRENLS